MLPAAHRVRRERDIVTILRRGAQVNGTVFRVQARPQPGRPFRATVVVAKKVDKRATVRNLLKRRTRAAVHRLLPHLSGADIVITVRAPATHTSVEVLADELRRAFTKLRLLQ